MKLGLEETLGRPTRENKVGRKAHYKYIWAYML